MIKNVKKFTAEKKNIIFLSKTTIYLSLGLHKGRPSYRRSLQLSSIPNFFLLLWFIFALLDPNPDSEYESTDLIESGYNTDPDPKH